MALMSFLLTVKHLTAQPSLPLLSAPRTVERGVEDPFVDGEGCGPNSECCSFNSPPWFTVQLPSSTTEDIEVRICGNDGGGTAHEDTPIRVMELYIK